MDMTEVEKHCERVARAMGMLYFAISAPVLIVVKPRRKYFAIDIGTSGAWLVERDTGEIYNIKAYGVADRNKKLKADIGNIATVDPAMMLARRWNYLR